VALHKRRQVGAADLLLAVEQHLDIAGQLAIAGAQRLHAEDLRQVLAFVVAGAAPVQAAVAQGRLEGRARPGLDRVGRLYVVVAVDQHGQPVRARGPGAEHDR